MNFDGYLDGQAPEVIDATGRIADPAFWPAFLYSVGGAQTAVGAFDVDPADTDVMLDELHQPDRWAVLTVALTGGHRVHVVFRNFPDDSGWDYLLAPAGTDEVLAIAQLEGHCVGPALCWPELAAIGRSDGSEVDRAVRMLLLVPAMADAEAPPHAVADLAQALTIVGARRDQLEVAGELLAAADRFWGTTSWGELHGVPACDRSFRGPDQTPAELRLIAEALRG